MEDTKNNTQVLPTTPTTAPMPTPTPTDGGDTSSNIIIEKKKRGRKKNSVISAAATVSSDLSNTENTIVPEKKTRKKRTVKPKVVLDSTTSNGATDGSTEGDSPPIKKRKRRVCKNNILPGVSTTCENNGDTNLVIQDSNNLDNHGDGNSNDNNTNNVAQPEEKVAKKRGRKPKGGKIITQHVNENNNTNDMPNIILHLKCSLSSIKNKDSSSFDNADSNCSSVESYNSSHITGSEINTEATASVNNTESCRKSLPPNAVDDSKNNSILTNYADSSMFKVYDPNISLSSGSLTGEFPFSGNSKHQVEDGRFGVNVTGNLSGSNMFNVTYSPDINLYTCTGNGNDFINCANNMNNACIGKDRDRDNDNDNDMDTSNLNEREIWRKINQLKLSFHKSDICQNLGGTQRSACFWCTCEFDSPAIYIPKSCSKEGYQVYGCFCSPECAAAFLMNENIDTSTRFERYHLLNSVYGKIYKYEKSIKIAPNPYYLLNKYYGNLTIQEYRKLFHSDQMIYVVNKPLTHILPELYEDNNDFLLNTKIIPTHSVNIKKNKPLKSNILNNAFGIN